VSRRAALALGCAALGVALALAHGEVFRAGASRFVPLAPVSCEAKLAPLRSADVTFEAWLVARHARTWLREPWNLFDTPHCAPDARTLTLGMPALALGLLGAPAAIFSREPLLVYNLARVLASAIAALAMALLVARWTREPAAGLAAGLLFAFHPLREELASHPMEWDLAWTALALLVAERLLATGRWRDVALLAVCGALQIAASFYALLASALLALPIGVWLFVRRAPRRASPAQLACAVAAIAIAAAALLGPFLVAHRAGEIGGRALVFYAPWQDYAPGGAWFPGAAVVLLAVIGLAAPRRVSVSGVEGDPRPSLLLAAVLVAFVAAGPTTATTLQRIGLPVPDFDPYTGLARVLPGLDSVRDVSLLASGAYLVICVLVGAGIAAAIRAAGRFRSAVAAAAIALAGLVCFGLGPVRWHLEEARPSDASIEFFARLARQGNTGALLELPLDSVHGAATGVDAQRVLIQAWHGRRTSACFASYPAPSAERIRDLASRLPDAEAVRALRELGFTTLVSHHLPGATGAWTEQRYADASREPDATLRRLEQSDTATAYELITR